MTESLLSVPCACLAVLYKAGPLGIAGLVTHVASRSGHTIQLTEYDVRRAVEHLVVDGYIELSSTGLRGAKFYSITRRGRDRARYLRRAIAGVLDLPIQIHERREKKTERSTKVDVLPDEVEDNCDYGDNDE